MRMDSLNREVVHSFVLAFELSIVSSSARACGSSPEQRLLGKERGLIFASR